MASKTSTEPSVDSEVVVAEAVRSEADREPTPNERIAASRWQVLVLLCLAAGPLALPVLFRSPRSPASGRRPVLAVIVQTALVVCWWSCLPNGLSSDWSRCGSCTEWIPRPFDLGFLTPSASPVDCMNARSGPPVDWATFAHNNLKMTPYSGEPSMNQLKAAVVGAGFIDRYTSKPSAVWEITVTGILGCDDNDPKRPGRLDCRKPIKHRRSAGGRVGRRRPPGSAHRAALPVLQGRPLRPAST